MYLLLVVASVAETAETAVNQTTGADSFWSATNILVTVLVGMITAIVTWKAAKANVNEKSLSYSLKIYPILNNRFQTNGNASWRNIKITYNNVTLANPCLVSLEIINTGNKGIENPPILISNKEQIEMIPLEVEDVPNGYIWKIESEGNDSCKVSASLINPKQKLRASFFMSHNPQEELDFSCAMCDLQCHEINANIETKEKSISNIKIPYSAVLGGIAVFLLLLLQLENMISIRNFFSHNFRVEPIFFDIYILSIPIVSLLFSYFMPKRINLLIIRHHLISGVVAIILFLMASIFLYMILNNIWIVSYRIQMVIAFFTVLLYSTSIHICYYVKK